MDRFAGHFAEVLCFCRFVGLFGHNAFVVFAFDFLRSTETVVCSFAAFLVVGHHNAVCRICSAVVFSPRVVVPAFDIFLLLHERLFAFT